MNAKEEIVDTNEEGFADADRGSQKNSLVQQFHYNDCPIYILVHCDTILAKFVVVVHMKINIIIVSLDLVPKNLPLECKQPKSMNTERIC